MVDIIPGGPGGASGGSGPGALPVLRATEIPVGDNSSVRVSHELSCSLSSALLAAV